jgi:hypothetical protein
VHHSIAQPGDELVPASIEPLTNTDLLPQFNFNLNHLAVGVETGVLQTG